MLCSLENYYWRYTSASELVNMILAFVETRAYQVNIPAVFENHNNWDVSFEFNYPVPHIDDPSCVKSYSRSGYGIVEQKICMAMS